MSIYNRLVMSVVGGAMMLGAGVARAAPADAGSTWSLRVTPATVGHGSNNEFYAAFVNAKGVPVKLWHDAAGRDACNGATVLRLSRTRANFTQIAELLVSAALDGRDVHVWYEPFQGECYIKAATIYVK